MTIKKLTVKGTNFECGRAVGSYFKNDIKFGISQYKKDIQWEKNLGNIDKFLIPTTNYFPWIVEEIRGIAVGADVSFNECFTSYIEENPTACSDIVLAPSLINGTVLIGHNNDWDSYAKDHISAIEWLVTGQQAQYTIGLFGLSLSVGYNEHGLFLSGDDLVSTDETYGISRCIIARAILNEKNFEDAVNVSLHPERASSYFNIIAQADKVIGIEATAKHHKFLYPKNGILIHTNHYTQRDMEKYERDKNEDLTNSVCRLEALKMRTEAYLSTIPPEKFIMDTLRYHNMENREEDICRHDSVSTVFSTIMNTKTMEVKLAIGNPCETEFDVLKF